MAYIIKHFARAIEYKLWLLLGYLVLSLASHLIEGTVIARYVTWPWWAVSWMVAGFILLDIVLMKGLQILALLYQQIPRKPIELLVCHFTVVFACVLLFLVSYTTSPWHGTSLMPYGVTWLVAFNILALSLYTTTLGLAVTCVLFVVAVNQGRWPKIASLTGVALVAYLLAFHVRPGLFILGGLVFFPPAAPLFGEISSIIANPVLHTPWGIAVTNVAQITFLLLLQGGILNYVLTGRVDVA